MDPFTLALATFGVQKLRGESTKRALRDAAIVGGGSYALGQTALEQHGYRTRFRFFIIRFWSIKIYWIKKRLP